MKEHFRRSLENDVWEHKATVAICKDSTELKYLEDTVVG